MSVVLARIYREPAKLLGFVVALLAVLTFLDVIAEEFAPLALALVAGAVGLLSYIVSPAWEVEVQRRPGEPATAGQASDLKTGVPVEVDLTPIAPPDAPHDERPDGPL